MQIKKLTELMKTPFLTLYDCVHENKAGKEKHWFMASRKSYEELNKQFTQGDITSVDAVVLVARHEQNDELVLIKQFRVPLNSYIYELPAGLIDKGETIVTSAIRELKEETGLSVVQIEETKGRTYLSPGMTDESAALVYLSCKGKISTEYLEEDEDIMPMLVSRQMAKEILNSEELIDIKAYMVLRDFIKEDK